ncbi:HAD-IIIC family phosphatase [Rhizobium sp. SAFR-030]|uniref:HAD-IIIC family phosphatase n=1 Tax=Rhizobium sp. SAFR-030 TaxID=3387277 RepID=UPI003F7F9636
MKIGYDSRILPIDGGRPEFALIFVHGSHAEDLTPRKLAERWGPHMATTLFAMPVFNGIGGPPEGASLESPPGAWPAGSLEPACAALGRYVDQICEEYGLSPDRVTIAGLMEGATLAFRYGLETENGPGSIVGFGGNVTGLSITKETVKSRPAVLLVHGETDGVVLPADFLQGYTMLAEAGIPVTTCFRPQVGRVVDGVGADATMFFLRGMQSTKPPVVIRRDAAPNVEKSVKLVIWDLDDTLWSGTLDDEDALVLYDRRVEALRRLNRSGVVSAICSKNDFETARRKLEELGLWDEFVFPRIGFVPKGPALRSLISDMQLKAKNCVFIDDNDVNIAEAKAALPDLFVVDAKSPDCDAFLERLVDAHAHVKKSRVEEYRSLESRVTESRSFDGDRENFLKGCDIHVAIASSADLVDFAPRIEELINRTNQLNYLKTRVQPGSMVDFVSEPSLREGFALFAWDKFGYHGLVGFIAGDVRTGTLLHMAFSCRIMHMGIENVLLHRAFQRFPSLQVPASVPVVPEIPDWITVDHVAHPDVRARILAEEKSLGPDTRDVRIRFMANCQSGVFSHFSGLRDVAEVDSHPRIFVMSLVLDKSYRQQNFPPAVVHYIGSDFYDIMWPAELRHRLDSEVYEQCVTEFCDYLKAMGRRLLVIGNPRGTEVNHDHVIRGVTRERMNAFNDIWRRMAAHRTEVDYLDVDGFVGPDRMADCVHFRVDASRDIAERIRQWHDDLPESVFMTGPLLETA